MNLSKCCFYKCCRRTDQRCHPHPEYSSRTTCGYCRNNADQISHSDTGCCRYDQCLKSRQTVLVFFPVSTVTISGNNLIGSTLVRMVKYIPAGIRSMINSEIPTLPPPGRGICNKSPHKKPYTCSINLTIIV